nr:mutant coat protein [Maize streak virus]
MSTSKRKRGDDANWNKRVTKKKPSSAGLKKAGSKADRPSLQIQTLQHAGSTMITVPSGGVCDLINTYARGSDEGNRHTSETLTYKIAVDYHFVADAQACKYSNTGTGVMWLVYDTTPGGQAPTPQTIFAYPDTLKAWPATWKVSRELCHRFVVKRRWLFNMETDGRNWFGYPSIECKLEALQAQHLLPQVHEWVGSENAVEECNGRRSWCHPERSSVHGHCPWQWPYIYCPWADPSVL